MKFLFWQEEAGDVCGFKHCLSVKELEVPTGTLTPDSWGAGNQCRAEHPLAHQRSLQALGTPHPSMCHLGGVCVQE